DLIRAPRLRPRADIRAPAERRHAVVQATGQLDLAMAQLERRLGTRFERDAGADVVGLHRAEVLAQMLPRLGGEAEPAQRRPQQPHFARLTFCSSNDCAECSSRSSVPPVWNRAPSFRSLLPPASAMFAGFLNSA